MGDVLVNSLPVDEELVDEIKGLLECKQRQEEEKQARSIGRWDVRDVYDLHAKPSRRESSPVVVATPSVGSKRDSEALESAELARADAMRLCTRAESQLANVTRLSEEARKEADGMKRENAMLRTRLNDYISQLETMRIELQAHKELVAALQASEAASRSTIGKFAQREVQYVKTIRELRTGPPRVFCQSATSLAAMIAPFATASPALLKHFKGVFHPDKYPHASSEVRRQAEEVFKSL